MLSLSFAHATFASERALTLVNAPNEYSPINDVPFCESPHKKAATAGTVSLISVVYGYDRLTLLKTCTSSFCTWSTTAELVIDGLILLGSLYYFGKNIKQACASPVPEPNYNSEESEA